MSKIAILSTPARGQEKTFVPTLARLRNELGDLKGKDCSFIEMGEVLVDMAEYDLLVFCGYDHITLAHIHIALHQHKPLIIFDEPGKSLERELNSVLFLGMDSGRVTPEFFKLITHCWSYRDVVGLIKVLPENEPGVLKAPASDLPGARPVENSGGPSTSKRARASASEQKPPA